MNINRHNYEDFFLLYADNELSATERSAVDAFVTQNPDLQEELTIFLSSVVKADNTIVFENKISLLRETEVINQDHEEKFILYHDNELSLLEKAATEKLLISNPSLQNEFALLQQVKFEADTTIVFPDKKLLYRKEERVVYMNWRRALAAAILLGVGLWTGITYLEKNKNSDDTITTAKQVNNTKTPKQIIPKADSINYVAAPTDNINLSEEKSNKKDVVVSVDQSNKSTTQKSVLPVEKIIPEITIKTQISQQDVATILSKNEDPVVINSTNIDVANTIPTTQDKNINTTKYNFVKNATYLNEEEVKSENYVFYNITQEEFAKSKIGTFFKKVKRVIERKNPLRDKSFKVSSIPSTQEN